MLLILFLKMYNICGDSMSRKRRKNNLFGALLFIFLFSACIYTVTTNTLHLINKTNEEVKLKKELKSLKYQEVVLKKDIVKMQSPDYIAKYAREKYFYSKPNEIIIKMD